MNKDRVIHDILADQDIEIAKPRSQFQSPSRLARSPVVERSYPYILFNFLKNDFVFSFNRNIRSDIKDIILPTWKELTRAEIKLQDFNKVKQKLQEVFEKELKVKPESIEPHTSPEDGEQEIIVTIKIEATEDPFKEILKLHKKLREIDWELAKKVVILPAE